MLKRHTAKEITEKGGKGGKSPSASSAGTPAKGKGKSRLRAKFAKGASKGSGVATSHTKSRSKSEIFRKACTLSFQRVDYKYRYIRLGLSEMIAMVAYRIQIAFNVSSQIGKLRTSWPMLIAIEYGSFWGSICANYVSNGLTLRSADPAVPRHATPDDVITEFKPYFERRKWTNVNTFLNNFTGHLYFGVSGIVVDAPRFDAQPPADANAGLGIADGGFVADGYLRIPQDELPLWYWCLHPRELTLVLVMHQQELDQSDPNTTPPVQVYGTIDQIIDFVCLMHWPAPFNTYAHPLQQARYRSARVCIMEKMVKSNSNSLQVAQTAYQGGVRQVIAEMLASRANWHFAASAMKVRFVDGAETALVGDRNLTHVRLRDAMNYVPVFDASLLTFQSFENLASMGFELRQDLTYHSEVEASVDVQETMAVMPMRVFALDGPPQAALAFTTLSKYCSLAHNDLSAKITAASFETIKEEVYKYLKERFPASKVPESEEMVAEDVTAAEMKELQTSQMQDFME